MTAPHPTAVDPLPGIPEIARNLLALADEPDALDRIRAVLIAVTDQAQEIAREEIRERIREVACQRAGTAAERQAIAARHLREQDPHQAAREAAWAASLLDQVQALRSVLG